MQAVHILLERKRLIFIYDYLQPERKHHYAYQFKI